ncbi:MAG: UDP-N-acetylglucosamine 1-carboxyvinyltransferase [Holosporales bacterium]|jgi:UDP-N-acetylglucosamine 1-carboxyvinyltransferase|nr:UDP-N-acetylglucosamine 1-carboxyvinyltransferase [Holosporales bacterium]
MDKIILTGMRPLSGAIPISGAKNAALPLMAMSMLTSKPLVLSNVPKLSDITRMAELLTHHGVNITFDGTSCCLRASDITDTTAPYDIVSKMRASIVVLGPLLARCGRAAVSLPGGCAIGTRPVNMHIDGLRALGANIYIENGYIYASAPAHGLSGATIVLPFATVTGTENVLMAATLANGTTVIKNAAREPEVCDVANCLLAMGAKISGIGTDTLVIDGVQELDGAHHNVIPDRIEAATYAIAGAITNGDVVLKGVVYDDLLAFWQTLERAGVCVSQVQRSAKNVADVRITMSSRPKGVDVMTEPHPGYPTDAQAQFMALMALCDGAAMVTETIFENRFMHVPELCRMCADITIHKASALVRGVKQLVGAQVMATDLRASVSLVLAGLAACGETTIQRVYHIDRGYERIEEKLRNCGAVIERVS